MRDFLKKTVIPFVAATLIAPSMMGITAYADATEDNSRLTFEYYTAFTSTTTFTPPTTGKYKIYVVGKSGDGAATTGYNGGGGGGSGGIATSILKLDKNTAYNIEITTAQSAFGADLYATAGETPTGMVGGEGGQGFGGNLANEGGYKGGAGGNGGQGPGGSGLPSNGNDGLNGGSKGGNRGYDNGSNITSGGGGGGGARLPDIYSSYIVASSVMQTYTGGTGTSGGYTSGSGSSNPRPTTPGYPALVLNSGLKLFGGGVGGGGKATGTSLCSTATPGTSGIVIIERCTDQTAPTVNTVGFSEDAKNVTITSTDDSGGSGVYGIYINGELRTGSTVNYSIPNGVMSLTIQAEDYAGNMSVVRTEEVPDKIPPEIKTVEFSEDAKTATITVTDEGNSGLKGIYVNGNLELTESGTLVYSIPEGVYTLILKAIDNAGNQSEVVTKTVPDVIPPTIEGVSFSADSKTATISLSDVGSSGIKGVYVNDVFKFSDSSGIVSVHIPDDVYSLTLQAMDNAENKSAIQTLTVPDVIPPTIDSCTFADGGISAVITASDKGSSGIKGIFINGEFVGGETVDYTLPKGIFSLTLQAVDNAGNKSDIIVKAVPDNIPPVIDSIVISTDGKTALIELSDTGGSGIKGATINGEFFNGAVITYQIENGIKYVIVQAEDHLGNTSETIKKRVPGWSEIVDTITINPVEFSENNTKATISASTTAPNTNIAGILINDVLYTGNPVTYKVLEGLTMMKLQAVNNEGDKSAVYTLDVPAWSGGVRISSVNFTPKNDAATIKAVDDTGVGIKGIYVNSEFFEGSTIVYNILNGTKHLEVQAINHNGDVSEIVVKRVPGWSTVVDTITVKSVDFANSIATITAESTGAAVAGIYVNDKFYDGNPILYTVSSSTKTLKLQAENTEGDKSPIIYKEVSYEDSAPIVNTLAVKSVEFSGAIATIEAESTSTDVSGIYINDKLFNGNPVLFPVTSSMKTIKAQAVNTEGERSPVIYKEVPTASSSSSSSSSKTSKSTGKARISITAPDGYVNASKAKVKISVSDSVGINSVEASTDYGYDEDITDQSYIYITKNTTVTITVINEDGETTKKSLSIDCFDRESPTVNVSQSGSTLNVRATDKLSGIASITVNGKVYKQSSGQLKINIPEGVTTVTVQAEDNAGNQSDTYEHRADKAVTAVPVAGATTTTVTPTPLDPEPELEALPEEIQEPEEEPLLDLLPELNGEDENSADGMLGTIGWSVLILGGGGALLWWNYKKSKQINEVDYEEIDLDYDFEDDEDNEDSEEETIDNVENVSFKVG